MLAALEAVDLVVVFEEDTPLELIRQVRPPVLVKGGDYATKMSSVTTLSRRDGGEVILVDLVPGHSTSSMVARSARLRQEPAPECFRRRGSSVPQLSAIIITKDEAANIGDCLDGSHSATSGSWSMPASSDGTLTDRQAEGRAGRDAWLEGFRPAEELCALAGAGRLGLSIDADERVSPELAQAIACGDRVRQGRRLRNSAPLQLSAAA